MIQRMPVWVSTLLLTLCVFALGSTANSAEFFVDAANTSGTEDGSAEWPYSTIVDGIAAATNGDTVTVAPGVYYGAITLKDDVKLISSSGPEVTVIDGEGVNFYAVFAPYEEGSLDTNPDSYIQGFTIRNGGNTLMQVTNRYSFWSDSTFDIRNCIFEGDGVAPYQRAHYVYPGANTVVRNSVYRDLVHATDIIWATRPTFVNNTFDNVTSAFFVYQQSVIVVNNTFSNSFSVFHLWGGRSGGGWFYGARNNTFNIVQVSVPVLLDSGELRYPGLYLEDGLEVDPLFTDASTGNYQLQAGSPLIDAGIDTAAYSTAYPSAWEAPYVQDVVIDYVGDSPDIGAYEFGEQTVIGAVENLAESYQKVAASDFKSPGEQRRNALARKFHALLLSIGNNYDEATGCELQDLLTGARDKLVNDIWAKGDGFYGGNPNNDWIVTQEEQDRLNDKVQLTLETIDADLAGIVCN